MVEKRTLSRRSFLETAGATAALAAIGLAGCDSNDSLDTSGPQTPAASWDAEYDVIVVGAGMAGLTAAITVALEGDGAKCLLIEKHNSCNGNSHVALGYVLWAESASEVKVYLDQCIGGNTPDDVVAAFAEGLTENLPWLYSLGAKEADLRIFPPGPDRTGEYIEFTNNDKIGMYAFTGEAGGSKHVFQFLLDTVNTYPDVIDYKTSTALEDLIRDYSTGQITGIIAGGKRYKANRGVIMCTGGYENNQKMLRDYNGANAYALAGIGNTGDGHRACMKIGADFWHMHGGALFWMQLRDLANTRFVSVTWNFTSKQYGITVGVNGRRFYQDYDGCYCPTPLAEKGSDLTCNVGYRHAITQFGGNWTHLPLPDKAWYIFDADGLAAGAMPTSVSTNPVADGWALTADSITELADKIEVPVDELTATVDLWNSYCEGGKDLSFYRPPQSLQPIKTGPFYAMLAVPTVLNTDGGPVRSAKAEILDPDGNPIPGLFSAGEFGSVWGHLYQGSGNLGECSVFGRLAARSALARG